MRNQIASRILLSFVGRPRLFLLIFAAALFCSSCTRKPPGTEELPQGRSQEIARRTTSGIVRDWLTDYKPFTAHPAIDYYVADSSKILIIIKTKEGKPMDTLVNQWRGKGLYSAGWHTDRGWVNGPYVYEFHAGDILQTKETYLNFADELEQRRK